MALRARSGRNCTPRHRYRRCHGSPMIGAASAGSLAAGSGRFGNPRRAGIDGVTGSPRSEPRQLAASRSSLCVLRRPYSVVGRRRQLGLRGPRWPRRRRRRRRSRARQPAGRVPVATATCPHLAKPEPQRFHVEHPEVGSPSRTVTSSRGLVGGGSRPGPNRTGPTTSSGPSAAACSPDTGFGAGAPRGLEFGR